MNPACDHYLEDPEANAEHLRECESCRALFGGLEQRPVELRPIAHRELPLAPWEGAAHRAWPLVVGGALAVLALALSLFVGTAVASRGRRAPEHGAEQQHAGRRDNRHHSPRPLSHRSPSATAAEEARAAH
jgi:hypothetical protein